MRNFLNQIIQIMKKNYRYARFVAMVLLFSCIGSLQAQTSLPITGIVIAATDGMPLPGATILVKGTDRGTTTDGDGKFEITVSDKETLIIGYLGYETIEVAVNGRSVIEVKLAPSNSTLEEVVVVGYGTQRKRDLTGSVGSVSQEEIKALPITSSEQALQGRVAGVQVIQGNAAPGGAVTVRIRGGNSALGGNEPLYVIDGFPIYNGQSSNVGQNQPSNALASINPNDIVSMEVLKDASATAIYGSRGANGVVMITTRRGKAGRGQIDFEAYYGVQSVAKKLDFLNGQEYMDLANEKARNLGRAEPFLDRSQWTANTDWQDVLFQDAPIQNYTLTFSGGNEKNRYAVSGNWFDQQGVVLNSGFKRGSVRINLDNQVNDKLSVSTNVTASRSINDQARTSIFFTNGIVYSALVAPPIAPTKNPDGTYYKIGNVPGTDPAFNNPLAQAENALNQQQINRILANTNITYQLTPELALSVRLGIDYSNTLNNRYLGRVLVDGAPGGKAFVNSGNGSNFLNENLLTYTKTFNSIHNVSFVGGYTWQEATSYSLTSEAENFNTDNFKTDDLASGSTQKGSSTFRDKNTLLSWFGRVNYILNDKYLLTLTTRADGSSRFGEGNKWGIFPSAAVAWRLSEEGFIKSLGIFSDLKIRASYGITGNQEIGNYQSLATLSSFTVIQGNQQQVTGNAQTRIANPDLKWETTEQIDVGLDVGFWDGRLNLTLDYYTKNTTDLLAQVPLALSSGFASILLNSGNITNKGFEVALNTTILNQSKWRWDFGFNFSNNTNRIEKVAVASGEFFAPNITSPIDLPVNIIRQGYALSSFYGYQRDGLWETNQDATSLMPNARAGDQKYKDLNGDGRITAADRTILGNPFPEFVFGVNSELSFGDLSLSVLLQGVQGNTVFNANKFSIADNFARNANQLAETKDRWTPENPNPNAAYPRTSATSPLVSDLFFEDASYLRLRNVILSYNLPVDKLGLKGFRSARIYISGQNLFTLTNYSGYDPEVSSTGSTDLRKGIDVGAYPFSKSYLLGIQLGF